MRVPYISFAVLIVLDAACILAQPAKTPTEATPPMPPGQLVRDVVYNELHDHHSHGYWRYWVRQRSQNGSWIEDQVETSDGPVERTTLIDGHPLSPEEQQAEQQRLEHLLTSSDAQARHLRQYDEDEDRIGRVLAMLPDAFLYEYAGEADGCYHLNFRPNPDYSAHTIEARIFHAMSGTLWIDARNKRLARLDGHFEQNVDFGFGILGRLYKGGWFRLQRVQVSPTEWKTESLEVHLDIRALLVKTFARDTSEQRGGFEPVPSGLTLAQGLALLDRDEAFSQPGPQEPSR
jgi:hypothetical protein